MPVNITNIAIYNRFRTEPVDWLLANVGDEIRIELTFEAKTFVIASSNSNIILNADNGYVGAGWVKDKNSGFKDFIVGDTVLYHDKSNGSGNNQTFTIIEKPDDTSIRLSSNIKGPDNTTDLKKDFSSEDCIFSVATPITALRYRYNFIENSQAPTFNSKVSGTEHQLVSKVIDASNTTPLPMLFLGEISYQTGSATAEGVSIQDTEVYTSTFKIIHNTKLTPLFLSDQWADLRTGKNATYFFNTKCLKAILDIKAATDYSNPNWVQQDSVTSILGETGGYGENFNSGITNYTIDTVVFKNSLGDVINGINLSEDETTFELRVKNLTDTPFVDNATKFELQFLKAPFDASEYQLNKRSLDDNFIDDRALTTVGALVVNGDQFGVANRQALKAVEALFISSSEIKITGIIALLPGTISVLKESQEPRYIFDVAIQDHTLETKKSDLVRLPISISKFFVDTSDPTLLTFQTSYFRHYESGLAGEGTSTPTIAPEDEVVAYSQLAIDKNGRATDNIVMNSITTKIKAKNIATGQQFDLDTFSLPLTALQVITQGGFSNQFIDFELDRVFQLPTTEIRKKIKIRRRTDLDNAGVFYYDALFPFLSRWEYWVKLAGVSGDFFDQNVPNNGQNQDWFRYSTFVNWTICFEISIVVTKNGIVLDPFVKEDTFAMFDYFSNPRYDPKTIKSYNPATNTELINGTKKYLLGFDKTLIRAEFTDTMGPPVLSNLVVNMHIEVYEEGGIEQTRRMSSAWPSDFNTWFQSIDVSNETTLTVVGNVVTAEVLVDFTKLPIGKKTFKIQSRLYEKGGFQCICPDGYTEDPIRHVCTRNIQTGSKGSYNWIFGHNAWLDFNTLDPNGHPTKTFGSIIDTLEGCTTISDPAGALLFYTDGTNLRDKSHALITSALRGGFSSSQSSLVLPSLLNQTDYFLCTVDGIVQSGGQNYGVNWSKVIDTGTTVSISNLNTPFPDQTYFTLNPVEKLAATLSGDGTFYWVVVKTQAGSASVPIGVRNTSQYLIYKFDDTGVIGSPILYSANTQKESYQGMLKFSGDGKKLVCTQNQFNTAANVKVELFDFDVNTGALSNERNINLIDTYGAEFNSTGEFLYFGVIGALNTSQKGLYRCDVPAIGPLPTPVLIDAIPAYNLVGGIQMAPNGKIYIVGCNSNGTAGPNYLSCINKPEESLIANIDFVAAVKDDGGVNGLLNDFPPSVTTFDNVVGGVHNNRGISGLPNFLSSFFNQTDTVPCGSIHP